MPEIVILGAVVTPEEADAFRAAISPHGAEEVIRGFVHGVANGSIVLNLTKEARNEAD